MELNFFHGLFVFANTHIFIFVFISWIIFASGIFQNLVYLLQLPAAYLELLKYTQLNDVETLWQSWSSPISLPVSIIVPAHDEEMDIAGNIASLLSLHYPTFELIVINDGSSDQTLEILKKTFSLTPTFRSYEKKAPHAEILGFYRSEIYSNLLVIDKKNVGSKADAVNAGLNLARHELFCVIDADSYIEPKALLRAVRPFMDDPVLVAVGGTVRVMNKVTDHNQDILSSKPLILFQTMEYIRSFLIARLAWGRWGMLNIISGAFGIFKTEAVRSVGGFSHFTVGEDYDLIIKLHKNFLDRKQAYAMQYVPEPVCWTEAPETLSVLGRQRSRWHRGALEVFFKFRYMLFNPKYGKVGCILFPYNLIVDVIGPIIEVIGYFLIPIFYFLGVLDSEFILAFFAIFFVFGVFISMSSLALEELKLRRVNRVSDLVRLIVAAILENFGYRQINNFWRLRGWWEFIRRKKHWGVMTRSKNKKN